ncbi:hypothetical protein [Alkalihalobacillus sp. BA299]|uniref:hypothetical protein n=1 Tax=Alkalihalobacillus sp. BA299 TaxID=2815938 RepID=UPI001ADD01FE|nr:hypothetical protein [Alkalihalobacillus sp. BA299]
MSYSINGFHDFYTILSNERKIGGVIEAENIKLRTGEVFDYPVFTNIDYSGSVFYSVGFITDKGIRMIVHVNDISMITSPLHKKVAMVNNEYYKRLKMKEKLKYLKRLYKADQGAFTKPFLEEAKLIVEDIGVKPLENDQEIDQELIFKISNKVIKIA